VPFHTHGAGYAEPVHGRKRWFLTPPTVRPAFHPDQTTLTWLRTHHADVRSATPSLVECTVRAPPPPLRSEEREDLVGSHARWKRPCLQTTHMPI
jgi:hypothetical protein